MDFSNIDEVMDNMRSYLDSHSLKDNDLMSCDEYVLGEGSNGKIDRLIELDKHGEYLGRYWNAISTDRDLRSNSKITFYVRKDGRLGGVWNRIGGMIDNYEIFDHYDGYFVGTRYMVMGRNVKPMLFAYYVLDGDKVSEILEMLIAVEGRVVVNHFKFDYLGDDVSLRSEIRKIYEKTPYGYSLIKQIVPDEDEVSEDFERVIDDQKDLCKQLKKAVKDCKDLEELVNAFFDVIRTAESNPEEEISYTAGTSPVYIKTGFGPEVIFNLMRWTPTEDDEFYQLQLNVEFDTEGKTIPYDVMNDADGIDALQKAVLESKSFQAFRDKKIKRVTVEVIET